MKINEPKPYLKGFSGSSVVKNPPAKQETGLTPRGQKDPLEEEMQPTPVFLLGKFHGQRSLQLQVMGSQRVRHDCTAMQQQQQIIYEVSSVTTQDTSIPAVLCEFFLSQMF